MKAYLPRVCDNVLQRHLDSKGAVLVQGPKWCGKTTTSLQKAGSVLYMQQPERLEQNLMLARLDPSLLLSGDTPRLIDEWQLAPNLWDAVRFEVDRRDEFGQFILTGSATPVEKGRYSHTGTGRIVRMRMRTMSLFESGDSNGTVSLSGLFARDRVSAANPMNLERVAFLVCRGGWPKAVGEVDAVALQQAIDYVEAIVEEDISRVDEIERSPSLARRIMRSLARMESSQGKLPEILADINGESGDLSLLTLRSYVKALQKLFVIEDLDSWNPNLRSKTAIRLAPTRHFCDPSIAAAALGAGPGALVNDLETFGLLFEGLCVRDLRVYAEPLGGSISHYRDKTGLECDAVVHLRDGRYGLVEVKLGGQRAVDAGAETLLKLANKIDTNRMGDPSFLMVLTGVGDYSYTRDDGVHVVTIGTLGV